MITTLIANFNNSNFIKLCVDSIISQEHNSKIIIADDGSTDNSLEIIKQYSKTCEIISNKNSIGFNNLKNIALQRCNTDFLSVVETQTIAYTSRYKRIIEEFNTYKDVSLVYSDFDFFDLKTSKINRIFSHSYSHGSILNNIPLPHILVYKTDILKKIGGFRNDDKETHVNMLQKSVFSHIPLSLYLQRGYNE